MQRWQNAYCSIVNLDMASTEKPNTILPPFLFWFSSWVLKGEDDSGPFLKTPGDRLVKQRRIGNIQNILVDHTVMLLRPD